MTEDYGGVLPDSKIMRLIGTKRIMASMQLTHAQIQPASLDLRLGNTAYRVYTSFLAGKNGTVKDRVKQFKMHQFDIADGAILEKNCVYVIPLAEQLDLPVDVHGVANARSTTGRLDVLTRLIADRSTEFDIVESGYRGMLYAEICPKSFSILVRAGNSLNQIRFRKGQFRLGDDDILDLHRRSRIVDGDPVINEGLVVSVDLVSDQDVIAGYKAKSHTGVVDLDRIDSYEPFDFWEPLFAQDGKVILDPGAFNILVSKEKVCIPPDCAAEMVPYFAKAGEFRVHYAGFYDPGFGFSKKGNAHTHCVLEVRCHEVPFLLEDGQPVARLFYEFMSEYPERLYGASLRSNYQGQGLKLSKQFRSV